MFDVHFLVNPPYGTIAKGRVSFSIRLAAFQVSGGADT
jgi:hypothetical protein